MKPTSPKSPASRKANNSEELIINKSIENQPIEASNSSLSSSLFHSSQSVEPPPFSGNNKYYNTPSKVEEHSKNITSLENIILQEELESPLEKFQDNSVRKLIDVIIKDINSKSNSTKSKRIIDVTKTITAQENPLTFFAFIKAISENQLEILNPNFENEQVKFTMKNSHGEAVEVIFPIGKFNTERHNLAYYTNLEDVNNDIKQKQLNLLKYVIKNLNNPDFLNSSDFESRVKNLQTVINQILSQVIETKSKFGHINLDTPQKREKFVSYKPSYSINEGIGSYEESSEIKRIGEVIRQDIDNCLKSQSKSNKNIPDMAMHPHLFGHVLLEMINISEKYELKLEISPPDETNKYRCKFSSGDYYLEYRCTLPSISEIYLAKKTTDNLEILDNINQELKVLMKKVMTKDIKENVSSKEYEQTIKKVKQILSKYINVGPYGTLNDL